VVDCENDDSYSSDDIEVLQVEYARQKIGQYVFERSKKQAIKKEDSPSSTPTQNVSYLSSASMPPCHDEGGTKVHLTGPARQEDDTSFHKINDACNGNAKKERTALCPPQCSNHYIGVGVARNGIIPGNSFPPPQCGDRYVGVGVERNGAIPGETTTASIPPMDVRRISHDPSCSTSVIEDKGKLNNFQHAKEKERSMRAEVSKQKMHEPTEYEACLPATVNGLMIRVGEIKQSVIFLCYRRFEDGSMGPAELGHLVRNTGDKIISINGISTSNKSFDEVVEMMKRSSKQGSVTMRFLERYASLQNGIVHVDGISFQTDLLDQIDCWVTNGSSNKFQRKTHNELCSLQTSSISSSRSNEQKTALDPPTIHVVSHEPSPIPSFPTQRPEAPMKESQKETSRDLPRHQFPGRKRKRVKYGKDHDCELDDFTPTATGPGKEQGRKHDNLFLMHEIEHLSRTEVDDETGLPTRLFTVLNTNDETLYDFRVDIGTSLIPNSGYGAFLTFLGARVLQPHLQEQSDKILENRIAHVPPTMFPLSATTPDGSIVRVAMAGDNLHGNDNCLYWPESSIPLFAPKSNGDLVRVKTKGANIRAESDSSLAFVTSARKKRNGRGLGFLEIFAETDYIHDSSREFCSYSDGCGLIDLGRYGPLQKEDRKIDTNFDFKNFIFDFEPAAWNFGVSEKIKGRKQIIDVTEDATGEPHLIAKENIPMYVNEVGHNKNLCQNVVARDKDDRVVHYYFHQDTSMKKGDKVELLVNYLDAYEETRERKGYGKANLEKGIKADDDDRSRLKRNFVDRKVMEEEIELMSYSDLTKALTFIHSRILQPVIATTDWFIEHSDAWVELYKTNKKNGIDLGNVDSNNLLFPMNPPHWRQWLARRRMRWLGERFQKHLDNLLKKANNQWLMRHKSDLIFVRETISIMEWDTMHRMLPFVRYLRNKSGKTLLQMMFDEMSEEVLYVSSGQLANPYDESLWCPIAMKLTKQSLRTVVASFLVKTDEQDQIKQQLIEALLKNAANAAFEVRKACKQLCQPIWDENTEISAKLLGVKSATSIPIASHLPFLIAATNPAYNRRISTGGVSLTENDQLQRETMEVGGSDNTLDRNCKVVEDSKISLIANSDVRSQIQCFASVARHTDSFKDGSVKINEHYYLLFQVVLVVHAIASSSLACNSCPSESGVQNNQDNEFYSLKKLCKSVGFNANHAEALFSQQEGKKNTLSRGSARGHGTKLCKATSISKSGSTHCQFQSEKKRKDDAVNTKSYKAKPKSKGRASKTYSDRKTTSIIKPITTRSIFWATLWKGLEELGWYVTNGKRPNDHYFMPPGTERTAGFKHRVDYFDSTTQLIDFLTSDSRWKGENQVLEAIQLFNDCVALLSKLRASRQMPENCTVDLLIDAVKTN